MIKKMDENRPQLRPITQSRSVTGSTRSHTRRQSNDLQRIPTSQSFDDHANYTQHSDHHVKDSQVENLQKLDRVIDDDDDSSDHSPSDIEKGPLEPESESKSKSKSKPSSSCLDPFLVDWSSDDPGNPKNWSFKRKWTATFIISCFTLLSPFSSSMVSPALPKISSDLGIKTEIESAMVLSIFVLAYAVGPLFLGPLSELYGRVIVLQLANVFYIIFNLACGFAKTKVQILVFRFLSGLGGSAPLAVGGAVLGDCFPPEQRGRAVSLYSLAPLLGPAIGPIIGGYISANTTWRWLFWSTTMFAAFIQFAGLFLLKETYAPTLLARRAKALRTSTGDNRYHTQFDKEDRTIATIIGSALIRPFRMLATQPIIQAIAVYMAFIYGLMYLVLTSFPTLWTGVYGESTSTGSLHFIALGLGFGLGAQIFAPINDKVYARLKVRYGGTEGKPEYRVPSMFVGATLLPVGLFIYGWTAQARTHWIGPDVGVMLFSMGAIACFQSMQTYIIDSYRRYAASGLAAAVVMRSLCGFGFPLFANQMYARLGYGWGNTLLACLSIVLGFPAPFIFWKYGEKLRNKSKYASQ